MGLVNEHKYDDIIDLPHHVSPRHPQMPLSDRAAQFSPFAALTGHEAAIRETARLTDTFVELGEERKQELETGDSGHIFPAGSQEKRGSLHHNPRQGEKG